MTMHRTAPRTVGAIALASVLALTLTSCGRGSDGGATDNGSDTTASPGITDTTLTLGLTTPLSGAIAGPGACTEAGLTAYFGAANAAGGIKFGDGSTRKIEIKTLDDAYDPQKALANFQQLENSVFAMASGLGTSTNRAYRDEAIANQVPQALVVTGDPIFSDPDQSPWQLGLVPTYANEGESFGKFVAGSGQDHKVAILSQNDDFGQGYVDGFKQAIEGAANVTIVKELTYEATDTSVDAQITELASTGADVFFNAMASTPLMISALQKAQQVGWKPSWLLPSNTSSPDAILGPGQASAYPAVYSVAFAKAPAAYPDDADVKKFLSDLQQYGNYSDVPPPFPHCMWTYIAGATFEQAFAKMTEPTRDSFMTALRSISGFQAPLMLPGTSVNTTVAGQPAVANVVVQKYNGTGYDTVTTMG
jgi:ABC-type branched-subunit amino acid transport system substrate-binding protein